jgi:DNA-binding MurR/RpiR family transcriptional regulator
MSGIVTRIKDNIENFNSTERRIAALIVTRPDSILNYSIAQLAEHSRSSQAAIVRFCKRLGFAGLKDIKNTMTEELINSSKKNDDESYSDVQISDSPREIIDKVVMNHIHAIEETAKILNVTAFQEAVDLLRRVNRVDIFGFGASGLVAQDMQQKFIRIGKYCFAYADVHLQFTAASSLTEQDAAVFISYSGRTKEILSCLQFVNKLGVKTIAITKSAAGPLRKTADIILNVCSPEISVRSGAMSSRITQLSIVDMLFISVAGGNYEHTQELLHRSYESVQNRKYKI